MKKVNYLHFRYTAERIARVAGKILTKFHGKTLRIKSKSDALDIVTEADEASERYILSELQKSYPSHDYLSEERGESKGSSEFQWIIDPLDGTKEFSRGLPIYNVSIALEYKGAIVVGVVCRPASNELYAASRGNSAFFQGKPIHVSAESSLPKSFVWTHLPNMKDPDTFDAAWNTLGVVAKRVYRLRESSEDVTNLCWLAKGACDGYVLLMKGPKWWDVAAGILMVEEAGGKVTDMHGDTIKNRDLSKGLVATNGKLHDKILAMV